MLIYYLSKSDKPNKRYVVEYNGKKIYFGSPVHENYTIHKDKERKKRYIQRHKPVEINFWNNPKYPSFWSRNILWNKKTLSKSISDTEKRYNIKIILK